MITNTLTTNDSRPKDGEHTNETNCGLAASLGHLLSGKANADDESIVAQEINRLIRQAVRWSRCGLSSEDMKDIGQTVFQQMLVKGIKNDRRLQALIEASAQEQEIVGQLRAHINMRMNSRAIDLSRKRRRENFVPAEDHPEFEIDNRKDYFPKIKEVLEVLQDPIFTALASKQDRDVLTEMLRSESTASQAAHALGIHKATVHRAVARMRPILRKAFGMD